MKTLLACFIVSFSLSVAQDAPELEPSSQPLIRPPAGRIAIVADGNSPDPDDIGATAVMFGLLRGSGLNDRLVHLSHSCDLDPFKNPGKQVISPAEEQRRQKKLDVLSDEGIALFGPFGNLADHFNCRADKKGAVNDLRDAINASSASDPLWIIEAGEPDIIGYALQAATPAKRRFVHLVSHHPANDNSGDFFTWAQLLSFGVNEHQVGDQNVGLQTKIIEWDWAQKHREAGIKWIWKQLDYAEKDGVVRFQSNKYDCSDAGMLYWWITGASEGGNKSSTPLEMKKLLLREVFPPKKRDIPLLFVEPIVLPEGGEDVVAFGDERELRLKREGDVASGKWVEIAGMPFAEAYRLDYASQPKTSKSLQVIVPIQRAVQKGEVVLLSFWVRRPKSGGEPGPAALYVQAGADQKRYEFKFSPYRKWEQHVRAFEAPADFDLGRGNISFHMGAAGPAIEVADLRLVNYGPDIDVESLPESKVTYKGRDPDAQWRKDALVRIEKIRKADLEIEVVDAKGNPVKGAEVKVEMQRHAFRFGNTVNSHLLGAGEDGFPYTKKRNGQEFVTTWEEAQKYREVVRDYFNAVTFESELRPHVWKGLTSASATSKERYDVLMKGAIPWLQNNEIDIRGHYLSWGAMDFNAMEKEYVGNPEAHRKWLWDHMADVLPKTEGIVSEWDTINHIVAWGKHTYEKEYGGLEILAEIMKEARRVAPNTTHAINEGKILPEGYKRKPYKRVIRFLNEQGQAPDTVGFMAHFGLTSLTPPEELLEVYDDFAEIAPKLQLSEFDVEAGDDEELQADYYRDVMLATFSHPNFNAIVQWGFWENAHWKPDAALWRKDWSLKPAGEVFVDLTTKEWWTDELLKTDQGGSSQTRGFLGDYTITITHDGKVITRNIELGSEGKRIKVSL